VLPNVATAALRVARACDAQERLAALTQRPLPLTLVYTDEQRERFYRAVCRRVEQAMLPDQTARELRLAEREAIHVVLEQHGLIQRTRGGAPLAARETEIIS